MFTGIMGWGFRMQFVHDYCLIRRLLEIISVITIKTAFCLHLQDNPIFCYSTSDMRMVEFVYTVILVKEKLKRKLMDQYQKQIAFV